MNVPEIARYPDLALALVAQADHLPNLLGTAQAGLMLAQHREFGMVNNPAVDGPVPRRGCSTR